MKFKLDASKQELFFTADIHLGHDNIIKYCNRPFKDTQEMGVAIKDNWNSKIKPGSLVFILGDVTFQKSQNEIDESLSELNGNKILIPGNHDHINRLEKHMQIAPPILEVSIKKDDEKLRFVMCHYAMRVWNKSHYGAMHLYGHSHGTMPDDPTSRSMDVGIDCNNYTPFSLDEVLLHMYKKVYKPIDHHNEKTNG